MRNRRREEGKIVVFFIFVEVYVGMCKCISRKLYIDLRDEIAVVLGYVKGALARLVFHFCYLFSYSFSYWYVVYSYFFLVGGNCIYIYLGAVAFVV